MISVTSGLLACSMLIVACSNPHTSTPHALATPVDDHAAVVGTWTTSTTSYADAHAAPTATRLTATGELEIGAWTTGQFVATPARSPGFVARYELDPASHTIRFALDGAEEQARYTIEAPDRWKTDTTEGEPVTVYYVRR
ncbi:MAG: hypothetical protein NT062_13875 [Proteobacteria bacterium]|nr:hypothetical protein [Pseudomonadota bacterium]